MADRVNNIQECVNRIYTGVLSGNGNPDAIGDLVHLYGVSSLCILLAIKRKLDPEIAAVSGLLHDVYRLKVGTNICHSESGAEMSRVILRTQDCFSTEEKQIILSAIYRHDSTAHVQDAYDELLKDADIFHNFTKRCCKKTSVPSLPRLEKISEELGLSIDFNSVQTGTIQNNERIVTDKRNLLAEAAEKLAAKPITGSRQDAGYMNLIRYWPEESAFDELTNGWCAAFVYHCCQEAGFLFPIKWRPSYALRFACVAAWDFWAREPEINFFIQDTPGFVPERGDIVLYRNSIPPENKPPEQRNVPVDHMGIVLKCDNHSFTAAEGNVNNENTSGILTRPLHQNVEGFIRIDNDLTYNSSGHNDKFQGV